MVAITDHQKARFHDLNVGILELVRDGDRDIEQVSAVFQIIKEHQDFAARLLGKRQEPPSEPELPLLELMGTVTVPALPRFVARERLVLNYGVKAKPGLLISFIGENAKAWLLPIVEEPSERVEFRHDRLRRNSVDGPILKELGATATVKFGQIFWLMEQQPRGEPGILPTDGTAEIFYVEYTPGVLCAVYVRWFGEGWRVEARSVSDPYPWLRGSRVLSRNSLVPQAA